MYALFKNDASFKWTDECQRVFVESKNWIFENDLLVHYDPNKPIGIVCDSSSYGIGAVLFHVMDGHEQPIMCTSCTFIFSNTQRSISFEYEFN